MTNVLKLYIAAAPNAPDISMWVVEKVSGTAVEFTSDIPAATQLMSPRNCMTTGATATAATYDCSGIYVDATIGTAAGDGSTPMTVTMEQMAQICAATNDS